MGYLSEARATTGLTLYGVQGVEDIMWMKFSEKPRSLRGYTKGSPWEYLYAIAAMVGIFAISRCATV